MIGSMWLELTLVTISVILSGIFSSSETALSNLSEYKLKQYIQENGKSAKKLNLWLEHPIKLLNTIFLGNTLSIITGSIIAGYSATRIFGKYGLVFTAIIMVCVFLVFGEILPKTYAKRNALKVILFNMNLLKIFFYLFYPISWVMKLFTTALLKMMGKDEASDKITEDDLALMIDASEEQGVLEDQKQQMLSSIFDISDIHVKEVMVPRTDMVAVPHDATREEVLSIIKENEYSRVPVYQETFDHIIGVLHIKDMIKLPEDWKVEELMSTIHEPLFVPETKKIDIMLKEFQRRRQQMAIVVDEYGGVSGLVTMEDILEEIVGEIWDEYDEDEANEQEVQEISENHYQINAMMNIDDLCDFFDIERTDDMSEYDTVGGLIYDIAGAIPSVGDTFKWRGFKITVQSMSNNKLELIDFEREESPVKDNA